MKSFARLLVLAVFVISGSALARGWIFSGGIGLTVSPDTFLINPQLEYVHDGRLTYGPMVQVGVGSGGSLFTVSGTVRYLLGNHPKLKPAVEGGFGLAVASSLFTDSVGVHLMGGMGVDYKIQPDISLSSMIRVNFAPPLKTFFLTWPLIMGRFAI